MCAHTCTPAHEPRAPALLPHHTSSAQPTPQHRNPTRNLQSEPGRRFHSPDLAPAVTAGAALAPIPPPAHRISASAGSAAAGRRLGGSLPQNLAGEGTGGGYRGRQKQP